MQAIFRRGHSKTWFWNSLYSSFWVQLACIQLKVIASRIFDIIGMEVSTKIFWHLGHVGW